jgi:thioredoxin-dependent peroxiredoxin
MKPLRRLLSVVVLGGALAVLATAVSTQQPVPGQPDLKVGDVAPDFTLQASDGQTYSLAKLKGKFVVLAWFPKAFTAG